MHMFALLPGTPPSLCSNQRVGWTFSFRQEHWEHVKPSLTAIELSFHLRRWGRWVARRDGRGEGRGGRGSVGGGNHNSDPSQPGHAPEEDRPQAGTTPSLLLTGAEKLAPLRRREQALTRPYSSRLSQQQIERVPCGFGDPFPPHSCPNLTERLKPPKKQVPCPDSTPRVRAAPTLLKK